LKELIKLNVNYALLRVTHLTDRMCLAFAQAYAAAGAEVQLLPSNVYFAQVKASSSKSRSGLGSRTGQEGHADVRFEEMELGTTYSRLRHLVVKTVTTSVSRTAGRMSLALARRGATSRMGTTMATGLAAIPDDSEEDSENHGGSVREVDLEKDSPRWDTPGWLNKTLTVEGFCPALVMQSAHSLSIQGQSRLPQARCASLRMLAHQPRQATS
jgi:hypothetical protein